MALLRAAISFLSLLPILSLSLVASVASIALVAMAGGARGQEDAFPNLIPARKQFGFVLKAAPMKPRAIGFYTRGCLAGAEEMPATGDAWQVMRPSRNRAWGHPTLIRYLKWLAREAKAKDGWPGLLIGDLAQPRGGPMLSGHRSHQVGLDADVWLTPMPPRVLTRKERETISATSMLASATRVNKKVWTAAHVRLLKRAVSRPEVERIFVHPAIKKALCEAAGPDKRWLAKIRPFWGHYYHFHVRLRCPPGVAGCRAQAAPPTEPRCDKELAHWFKLLTRKPKPAKKKKKKRKPRPPLTLAGLPKRCAQVLGYDKPPLLEQVAPRGNDIALPIRKPPHS